MSGRSFGGGAIKTDNTLWTWGSNAVGCLGQNSPDNYSRSSPIQIPGTDWSRLSINEYLHTAIKTDGTLWTWGQNYVGGLGQNDQAHRSSPTQVPGTNWAQSINSLWSTAAIKTDGTLWAWGYNVNGQLGQNNTTYYSSPVQIPGTNWSIVRAGGSGYIAKKTDNTLWVWGDNNKGTLGLNTANPDRRSSPVQLPGEWSSLDQFNFTFGQSTGKAMGQKLI